ncbi:hypothetical protein [Thiobacillus sp.]|uniref:hypothetical protein n=1 Tax=Thiobacillus sp. TaxID=924 RepID=UPI00286DE326|nr:hypothetical protein [Thiobacillus sp.]
MNKKEIQAQVTDLLSSGVPKSEVFAKLSGQGVKDSQLAHFIASYADPFRCDTHDGKINILITIMFIQALFAALLGFGIGAKIGPNAKWITPLLIAAIPLLFAWGFYKYRAWAFNAYILLSIVQLPRSLEGFTSSPIATSIGFAISVGMFAYVWYVREKIFPDFAFITPKKTKGKYIFGS